MATVPKPAAGWYPDPQRPQRPRYWDGAAWRTPTAPVLVVIGSWVLLTLLGFATALSQAPTCHPSTPVSTPASTPLLITLLLWLGGVGYAATIGALWWRRGWSSFWQPMGMLGGAVLLPAATWVVAAGSCGL